MTVSEMCALQRGYFDSGVTRSVSFRRSALLRLLATIEKREEDIFAALKADLNKSEQESYLTEVGVVKHELRFALRHMGRWTKKKKVGTPLFLFPSQSAIYPEPYGLSLIMSPWNYPFLLTMGPLISSLAAGNCAILKPSAYAPATSSLIVSLVSECFPAEYVAVAEGGRLANMSLLKQKFDIIFFTGSVHVGKEVMEAAAKNLTPVVLELSGKSPCIIERTADLELAAKRIAFGKGINAGQTCVAPDYVLVQRECKDEFIQYLRYYFRAFYGENPAASEDWPKIINEKHFERLQGLISGESVVHGGEYRAETLKISPTILDNVSFDAPVMQEEIFGPVLPVIPFDSLNEAMARVRERSKPLAFYLFSENKETAEWVLNSLSFGGGCVNDTVVHLANPKLPFGGVSSSGMGKSHGKAGFDSFTHYKSVLFNKSFPDLSFRYPPASKEKLREIQKFLK